jgi:hypothetical protein
MVEHEKRPAIADPSVSAIQLASALSGGFPLLAGFPDEIDGDISKCKF